MSCNKKAFNFVVILNAQYVQSKQKKRYKESGIMGVVVGFIVERPPLLTKIYLPDSGRNAH